MTGVDFDGDGTVGDAPESFEFEHVGSTAVPGFPGKPYVDIEAYGGDGDALRDALVGRGYTQLALSFWFRDARGGQGEVRGFFLHLGRHTAPATSAMVAFRAPLQAEESRRATEDGVVPNRHANRNGSSKKEKTQLTGNQTVEVGRARG